MLNGKRWRWENLAGAATQQRVWGIPHFSVYSPSRSMQERNSTPLLEGPSKKLLHRVSLHQRPDCNFCKGFGWAARPA